MGIPKISYPTFVVDVPSTKQSIHMRPFLVKEEKILLLAQTSQAARDVVTAIQQVVNNCIIDDIDFDSLTTFDIDFLFIKLRAKSVGNVVEMKYRDPEDEHTYNITIDLDDVDVKFFPDHSSTVEITPTSGLTLKYPKADLFQALPESALTEVDILFQLMKYCIKEYYTDDEVFDMSDYSDKEKEEFVESLNIDTFEKIQQFIQTIPKLYHEAEYIKKDGTTGKLVLQSLNDFFTLR